VRFTIIPWKHNAAEYCMNSRRQRFLHIINSTSFIFWLAIRTVSAQTHESAFSEVRTFLLPAKFEKSTLVSTTRQNKTILAAWSAHHNEILLATFDSAMSSVSYSLKHTAMEFDDLSVAEFTNDGSPGLLLVNKQERTIGLVLHLSEDTLQVVSKIKLPFAPDKILIGDYNNDGYLDVLLYAHNTPGILPLIGNGKGHFMLGKIIAPDNAIGAADFAHVNNDNLVDLIVWDWVKSELHVLYGVGKGRFIDQSVFHVQGDVDALVATSIVREHSLDLILKMTNPSGFQIWEGNDYGDFQLKNRIEVEGRITDFGFADINNNGLNDIIISINPASLQVVFNNDGDAFSERVEYASGSDPQNIFVISPQSGNPKDCIVFDRNGEQFIVYRNASRSCVMVDSVQIATGVFPTEIVANDFNRDGISDIALINKKSQSVSLYFGQNAAAPSGPFSYSLTDKPNHIAFHSSTDTTMQFVLSFPQPHQISYFIIDSASNSVSNAFIGCEGDAQIVGAVQNSHDHAKFDTWNTTISEGSSLSFYEQLNPTIFIERTFRLSPPDDLLGASVADLNSDGLPDIVYAYRAGDTSTVELGVAFGDTIYSMKRRIVSRELSLPEVKQVFIWLADFDKDGILDLLIQAGPPGENFMVAKGKGEGYYYDPKIIAGGISVTDRSEVQIVDVDGDGFADIVIGPQKLGRVIWYRNQGDCSFDNARVLAVEPGLSHFVVADVNADGVNDLAMTLSKKGILKIINGKCLSLQRETGAR
jgi:FG-GAP-like repeat